MSDGSSIPIVLCVDVEPDARILDPGAPSPWDGFRATLRLLARFRIRAAERTGAPVHVAWFLRIDPQVEKVYGSQAWVVDTYRDDLDTLQRAGDHLGLHVHACRWVGGRHGWLVDYGNQPWVDDCLTGAFDAFARTVGFPCETFRFGDRWMNQATFERVAALGATIDLTLEPGCDDTSFYGDAEPITGVLPDYRGVPERPYLPSPDDYRVEDRRPSRPDGPRPAMWEMPVTTGRVKPSLAQRLYRRHVSKVARSEVSPALVSLRPSVFRAIVEPALMRDQPHLVLTLRTGAMTSAAYAARIDRNLEGLLDGVLVDRFRWTTPGEALALLRAAGPSPAASPGGP